LQQQHAVAGGERAAGNGLFARKVMLEDVRFVAAEGQLGQHGFALRRTQRAARPLQLHRRITAAGAGRDRRQHPARSQRQQS